MPRKSAKPHRPVKSEKSAKSRKPAMRSRPVLLLKTPGARALLLVAVFVAIATLTAVAGRQPSQPETAVRDVAVQSAVAAHDAVAHETVKPQTRTPTPAPREATRTPAVRSNAPVPASTPADVLPPAEPTRMAAASEEASEAITITGCLERDDARFRLTDTEGENAPRSRSWTTGFLTRKNRSVEVADSGNRFNLANRVGERVSATGTIVDGDMQIRSLRRVARSCDEDA